MVLYRMNALGVARAPYRNLLQARRALVFVFVWSLAMIATLQLHHALNDNTLSGRGGDAQPTGAPYRLGTLRAKENSPLEPLVDRREPRTEEELVRDIESRLPSLPFAYWLKMSAQRDNSIVDGPKSQKNDMKIKSKESSRSSNVTNGASDRTAKKACTPRYPSIYELEFSNIYWQTLRTSNGTFQLYGAYYDTRKLLKTGTLVRIVGMLDRVEPRVKTYCQLWYDGDTEAAVVRTFEYKYIWNKQWGYYKPGIYQPYVIACKIPRSHQERGAPASVSLVERPCDTSTNNLRVIYNRPKVKRGFAVCVKGLDFLHDDLSVRLIEWIELVGLLGADKIYFYQLQVHPNVTKVLDHYSALGKIEVTQVTLPGGQPNIPAFQHMYLVKKVGNKRLDELIPYNDCLYKHMYEYEYIALLDIDEVIMPLKDSTWPELMKRVLPKALASNNNQTMASYNVRNIYFLDDFLHSHGTFEHMPKYMHMLQHVYRSRNFTKPHQYIKCFHNPERVVTLHNHYPLACLDGGCTTFSIETEDAQLQHYRADCVKALKSCSEYKKDIVNDTTIWRYSDRLIGRVSDTLEKLGFFVAKNTLT